MKKLSFLLCFYMALLFLFNSCADNAQADAVLLHTVERKDFVNTLTASGELEAVKTSPIVAPRIQGVYQLTIIHLVDEGTYLNAGDTVCIFEDPQVVQEYQNAMNEVEKSKAEYEKTVANLNLEYLLLESQVNSIDAQTAIARLNEKNIAFAPPIRQKIIRLEIEQAEINKEKLLKKMGFLKDINESELKKMKTRIIQSQNNLVRQQEKLDKMILTTQVEGILQLERNWSTGQKVAEGDNVWRGFAVAKIPDLSKMQVKLQVNDAQVKRIQKDQPVEIHVDARPGLVLRGKITRKTPMGRPVNRDSKVKVFDAYASIDTTEENLKPGLSATCTVFINHIEDTVVVPLYSIFERDSLKVIYKKEHGKFIRYPIEMGVVGDNEAVIVHGLSEGEIIALMPPPDKFIQDISTTADPVPLAKGSLTRKTIMDSISNGSDPMINKNSEKIIEGE